MATGDMVGEIRYTVQNLQFTEFRLTTDPQNTADDNIYITTTVRGNTGLEFTQAFYQSVFLRVKVSIMSVEKFGYF
jgi:hypothetical protein